MLLETHPCINEVCPVLCGFYFPSPTGVTNDIYDFLCVLFQDGGRRELRELI